MTAGSSGITNQVSVLNAFQEALSQYIASKYSQDTRQMLFMMYTCAVSNGLTNRAAYIYQLFTWGNAVGSYAASFISSVLAASDIPTADAMTWDFTQISTPDPAITIIGAFAISN